MMMPKLFLGLSFVLLGYSVVGAVNFARASSKRIIRERQQKQQDGMQHLRRENQPDGAEYLADILELEEEEDPYDDLKDDSTHTSRKLEDYDDDEYDDDGEEYEEDTDPVFLESAQAKDLLDANVISTATLTPLMEQLGVEDVDVLIVGAGAAGLNAGYNLANSSRSFVMIEASERIGGRVDPRHIEIWNGQLRTLEQGAGWISGGKLSTPGNIGNPLADLANETDVKLRGHNQDFEYQFFDNAGVRKENEEWFEDCTKTAIFDQVIREGEEMSRLCVQNMSTSMLKHKKDTFCRRLQDIDWKDISVEYLFRETFDFDNRGCPGAGRWDPKSDDTGVARAIESLLFDLMMGDTTKVAHAKSRPVKTYDLWGNTERLTVDPRGFILLLKKLASKYLKGTKKLTQSRKLFDFVVEDDRVRLNTKLVKVFSGLDEGGSVLALVCDTRYILEDGIRLFPCRNGIQHYRFIKANDLLSTISVGVWGKSLELDNDKVSLAEGVNLAPRFYPALTSTTAETQGGFTYHKMGLYTKIAIAFEEKFWPENEYFLSAASDGDFLGDFAPLWQNLDRPELWPDSKLLLCLTSGPRARDINSNLSDEETVEQLLGVLSQMFPEQIKDYYGRDHLTMDDAYDYFVTNWHVDPLFWGSFSLMNVGIKKDDWPAITGELQYGETTGIEESHILISGEHTCTNFKAFYHGALLAGERSAHMLMGKADPSHICDEFPGSDSMLV
ncbi:Polyamine oxidase [Seminavis robusta]|uniref:Polyamine oxidase n=1 Tax=Seminavis robusta TaxID=568900 RepID=A0A9N8HQF2_9STRA|nr:Polyamine oxidase [Seminavis robusta]|eukprot:Sro1282_g259000.1 Polyamine oxidase (727) ;mRNA; r:15531-17863